MTTPVNASCCLGSPAESQTIISTYLPVLLQGSNTTSMLKEKLRAQLVHLAAAYSRCVLCIEGSPAFELSVISAVEDIITLGRRCDVALCVLTACSPAALEVQSTTLPTKHINNSEFCDSVHAAKRKICSRCGAI